MSSFVADATIDPPSKVIGTGLFGDDGFDEVDDGMLLDPPDPVDLLIAHTHAEDPANQQSRPLDFIRAKLSDLKKDNKKLRERVADLEQTLSIVQTAQEWTMGKGMTQEQAHRMQEIKALLEQADRAKKEMQNFTGASRAAMYEKLRACKAALRREKQDKLEMKDRLMHCFDHARAHRDMHRKLARQREEEHETWNNFLKEMKERHQRELRRLAGDPAALASDRRDQLSHYGEQVMSELSALQQHLKEVRSETVDAVILEGDDFEDFLEPTGRVGSQGELLRDAF
ncbi:unnamed protein product [Polarella glacialis]|uniref:Uncharacterized protein n=1 Tax=Polarella glacialis TaxID=89957 RepID=A0A813KX10_POLGL|nr:unnamed protein product [Polarella glacialis]